jgi:hypothetical protein
LIETQVDELRTELEYQHKRLDEARDAALAQCVRESDESFHVPEHGPHRDYVAKMPNKPRVDIEAADAEEQAHQDWSNDE